MPDPTGTVVAAAAGQDAAPAVRRARLGSKRALIRGRLRLARRPPAAARPPQGEPAAEQPAQASGGLVARLWPPDKPIYKRPAAIGGAAIVVGLLGYLWWLGGGEEERAELPALPERAAPPALPA
jgi:hypothetical protein